MMHGGTQQGRRWRGVALLLLFVGGYLALRAAAWLLGFVADHWWQLSLCAVLAGGVMVYLRNAARQRRQAQWQSQRLRGR